jgi:hypothetical protein
LSKHLPTDATRLLRAIAGTGRVTLQTFDDRKPARPGLARVLQGRPEVHATTLAALNAKGAGVYFMVAAGDGKGRRAANVTKVRALFVDLDGSPLEPVLNGPLLPHATVESSPGRFHAYWLVEGVQLAEFTDLQTAIAQKFDGDPTVKDLPRVMRLPGYLHNKAEPFPCRLLSLEDRPRIPAEIARAAFGKPKETKRAVVGKGGPKEIPEGERNDTLFSKARGFVAKGYTESATLDRLQKINAEQCTPPLCATEVDDIVKRAMGYGSTGATRIPNEVLDSMKWRTLDHKARSIVVTAYRRHNGDNNGNISLPFADFADEFSKGVFYRMRKRAVRAGFLCVTRESSYSKQGGKVSDLFAIGLVSGPNGVQKWNP